MAAPQSQSSAPAATATGNCVAPLPDNLAAGDLVLVFVRIMGGASTVSWPASPAWIEILDDVSDASNDTTALAYRYITGTEGWSGTGNSITLTNSSAKSVSIAWRITGAADPATIAPFLSSVGVGTGGTISPVPSLHTGTSRDYLGMTLAAWDGAVIVTPGTPPTGYSDVGSISSGTGGTSGQNGWVTSASKTATAASDSPSAWGSLGGSVNAGWTAITLAIPPVPAAGTNYSRSADASGNGITVASRTFITPRAAASA